MKIFIATDITLVECQGRLYAREKYSTILRRYYNAFGPIIIFSRFVSTENATVEYEDVTDIIIDVIKIESLSKALFNKYNKRVEEAVKNCDLVISRCPSISAYKAAEIAKRLHKPYFAECMGCPWDAYWNHGMSGKIIAPYMFFKMRNVVKHADYALYVTKKFLQGRYPCKNESVGVSDVVISSDCDVQKKREEKIKSSSADEISLMTTAGVNVRYKGQQYVIKSIPRLNRLGIRVKYLIVGEGDQSYLRNIAQKCGVEDQVVFTGAKPLAEVFEMLNKADIYIQPSLQEGLPRAVVEAMGRGCHCIGAKTGGIPELLDKEFVIRRKSVSDIVDRIYRYVNMSDEQKMQISSRNFEESKNYEAVCLNARREAYYEKVKEQITK